MQVIGAGFGRTGTMSLKVALETLGFGPCYHMTEVFEHPEHADLWLAAWRGEPVKWDGFLNGYESLVDWPACTFYEDLMKQHPDAKILLSIREPDRWYESTRSTIYELSNIPTRSALSRATFYFIGFIVPGITAIVRMAQGIIWNGTFGGNFEDRRHAINIFDRHNEEVRRRVPAERLLVYEVKEGWEPLCEFLGVAVPDEPFPRLNDKAEMRRRILGLRAISFLIPAILTLLAVLAVVLIIFRRRPGAR